MSLVLDLNFVCLVCLRKPKKYHSIYDADEQTPDLQIIEKILKCSDLNFQIENSKLPDKICDACLSDLMSAWRFQKNCKKANNMFQYVQDEESEVLATIQLEQDEIKMPLGLKIKRMKKPTSEEPSTTTTTANKNTTATTSVTTDDDSQPETFPFIGDDRGSPESIYVNLEGNQYEEVNTDDDDVEVECGDAADELYLTEEMTEEDEEEILLSDEAIPKDNKTGDGKPIIQKEALDVNTIPPKRGRGRPKKYAQSVGSILVEQNDASKKIKTEVKDMLNSMKNGMTKKTSHNRHRRNELTDSRSPKICEICGNSYKYQHALNAHMRRHNNVRPYACEFCDKSFVACVELQRHMRVHTGHKPYACQYCDRRFSDFGSRIKHERTHTGERPYRCTTCNKCFAYAHVLSVHVRTHTGEKRFQCGDCGKGFTKKAYLLAHQGHNGRSTCIPGSHMYENTEMANSKSMLPQDNDLLTTEYVMDDVNVKFEDVEEDSAMEEHSEQILVNKVEMDEVDEENMAEEHLDDDDVDIVYEIQTN